MSPEKIVQLLQRTLADLKGRNILSLDVRNKASFTDYMLIAEGGSRRHLRALAQHLHETARAAGIEALGMEGNDNNPDWVLLDFNDVIVHLMLKRTRAFYDLERLWGETDAALRVQQP